MNHSKFLPNDPKLTAYALGELEGFERATVEAALREDPAARAAVEEIRALTGQLEEALALEAAPEEKRTTPVAKVSGRPSALAKVTKFPQFYYVIGGLAAACFALMVALRTPKPPAPQTIVTELRFAPAAASAPVDGSAAATAEADRGADAPAPAVTLGLVAAPGAMPTASPLFTGNVSLLGQAKDLSSAASIGASGSIAQTGEAPAALDLKKEALRDLTARNEPLVIETRRSEVPVRADAVGRATLAKAAVAPTELRAQRVSATQTFPGDEKMVVNARAKAAVKTEPTAPSLFEQSAKQTTGTLSLNGGKSLAAADAFSYGFGGVKPTASGALTLGGTNGAVAMNSSGGQIFSENRGMWGYRPPVAVNEAGTLNLRTAAAAANTERYAEVHDNEFLGAAQNPLSTFSVDVDTASYSNVRRFLKNNQKPPRDAVRVEELVNYFPYRYLPPAGAAPFAASLEVADAPWAPEHRLVRIGLKGREVSTATRPGANLVFLLDVSGSMNAPNRLPLVKESMRLLVGKLRLDDRVAIVTYAGQSGLALESTPVSHAQEILDALDSLTPGGSTNGSKGLQLAYDIAKANFVTGGINRVILCTDGDFNVGVTGEGDLTRLIEEKAKSGVALTALGFGMGNLKDAMIEKLADHGNGNYGYIDSRREAEKLLVEQVNGTLLTIAQDVKIQVEFNPARVASYRLLGYENRLLKKEDFNNAAVDAGEIGAGHTVTAFYEVVPVGADDKAAAPAPVDALRYASVATAKPELQNPKVSGELLTVKLNFKEPRADATQKMEFPLTDSGAKFADASSDFKFAAAVAGFGMVLRDSPYKGTATMNDVVTWAENAASDDAGGYRSEFVDLARDAEKLTR